MTNVLALELWLDDVWRSSKFKTFCPGFISLRKEGGGVSKCKGPPLLGVNPQILSCQRLVALTDCNLQGTPLPLTHI